MQTNTMECWRGVVSVALEKVGISEEELMSVRDQSLESAYQTHDIGQDLLEARLEAHGFTIEQHGTDNREADEVVYGFGPDIAVHSSNDEGPVAYIELKTKTDEEWFGRCNLRHYREYVNFSNEVDVPVFVWFALVDDSYSESSGQPSSSEDGEVDEANGFIHRDAFVEVEDTDQIDSDLYDVSTEEVVFYEEDVEEADDGLMVVDGDDLVGIRNDQQIVDYIPEVFGNEVISLNEDQFRSFPYFLHRIDSNVSERAEAAHSDEKDAAPSRLTSLEEIAQKAQQLLWERMQPNPSNHDIVQLRTNEGKIGPRIDEESDVELRLDTSGEVAVTVDGEYVELGSVTA